MSDSHYGHDAALDVVDGADHMAILQEAGVQLIVQRIVATIEAQ